MIIGQVDSSPPETFFYEQQRGGRQVKTCGYEENNFTCGNCRKKFKEKYLLQRHRRQKHGSPGLFARPRQSYSGNLGNKLPNNCGVCSKFPKWLHYMRRHRLQHINVKRKYNMNKVLLNHEHIQREEEAPKLALMGEVVIKDEPVEEATSIDFISNDENTDNDCKTFFGEIDNKEGIESSCLDDLYERCRILNNGLTRYKCDVCAKIFRDAHDIRRHYETHIGKVISIDSTATMSNGKVVMTNKTPKVKKKSIDGNIPNMVQGVPLVSTEDIDVEAILERCRFLVGSLVRYKCDICRKVNRDKYDHMRHYRIHLAVHQIPKMNQLPLDNEDLLDRCRIIIDKLVRYKCDICYKIFKCTTDIRRHYSVHKNFVCQYCGLPVTSKSSLVIHQKNKHPDLLRLETSSVVDLKLDGTPVDSDSKCTESAGGSTPTFSGSFYDEESQKYTAQQKALLDRCRFQVGKLVKYKCDVCDKIVRDSSDLRRHYRVHTRDKDFVCEHCGLHVTSKSGLTMHQKRRHPKSKEQEINTVFVNSGRTRPLDTNADDEVSKGTATPNSDVVSEKSTRIPEKAYRYRGRHTAEQKELFERCRIQVGNSAKSKFRCDVCQRILKDSYHFTKHYRIHSGERPYCCEQCGKTYRDRQTLQWHVSSIHDKKRHPCPVCGTEYTMRANMLKHLNDIHSEQRLFPCEICGKSFKSDVLKKRHLKTHWGRTIKCDVCDMMFKTTRAMVKHKEVHSNNRLQSCGECGRGFRNKKMLKEHMSVHDDARSSSCMTCGKVFKMITNYKKHMLTH